MKIEQIPINDLTPYARNSRTHSAEQITQVANSIQEFGFTNPVLIDKDGGIIAGHGRVIAAKQLGIDQVPCIRLGHLSEAQKRAYVIADNKLAENSGWDEELLQIEIEALQEMDFSLDLLGFDTKELETLMPEETTEGLTDPDETPEPPPDPTTQLGDIWLLGNHRLMCGDSTSRTAVEALMAGEKADMVFTDPPYGINIGSQSQGKGGGVAKKNEYGNNDWDKSIPYEAISLAVSLSDYCVLWGANYYADKLPPSSCWVVWDKDNGSTDFADIEMAWTSYSRASRLFKWKWAGMLQQNMKEKEKRVHPTQKPTALAEWAFDKFDAGKNILDLFLGSGSTLIACEKTFRNCYGLELDPKYCDVIIQRWQNFTGKTATLQSTGKTYAQTRKDRT